MFNVAVIRLKDIKKYFFIIGILILIVIIGKEYFSKKKLQDIDISKKISSNISEYAKKSINLEIPEIEQIQKKDNSEELIEKNAENSDKAFKTKIFSTILGLELSAMNSKDIDLNNIKVADNNEENNKTEEEKENKKEDENVEFAKADVKTEVITKEPLEDVYTKKYKSVKIKNETSYDLTDEILNYDKLKIDKSNIIIFHTHTCESYTSSEKYSYTPTGNFRTTDKKYSVVRVGDELTKYLKKYKIDVVHDKTYHDYPAYTGSYSRSAATVSNLLKTTKADIIIDLHRDAIGRNSAYAPTVKIGDDMCAQLMFVMGSNGGGLKHDNWKNNLQFSVKIQEKANKIYPGLFKPIILRNSRYNQNLGKAACIIEVGSTGNTLEQCLNSMKYLSKIINEYK